MNSWDSAASAVLGAVLNTLWQAAAGTVVIWLALRYTRLRAAARYAVWWGWLAVLVVLPLAPSLTVHRTPRVAHIPVARPMGPPVFFAPAPIVADSPAPVRVRTERGPLVAMALWLMAVLLQGARLAWSAIHLRRLKREGRSAEGELLARFHSLVDTCIVRRPVRLLISQRLASPMAVGFRGPAVLLPQSLLAKLGPEDLDHVLLHELAHLARRDDWTNLAARIAAAFLGWHPAALWVLRRIDREREIACDEWVVATTGAARPYAASLARLFELCWTRKREALATGMAGSGSHLSERIEMLVRRTGQSPRNSLLRAGACAVVLLLVLIASARAPRWVAFAQNTAPRHVTVPPPNPQSFLAVLVAAGYGDLPVDDIIALKNRGISPDFLRGVSHAGWGKLTAQQLIDLRSRNVDPEYLHDIHDAGIRDLNIQGVIELRARNVAPDYARNIHSLGFGPYSAQQMIDFSAHAVPVDLFRALREFGFTHLTPSEIIEARNSGLQAGHLREAKQYGASLSIGQILKLKRAGVL